MNKGLLFDWATAGAILANADDNSQAEFFKGMVKELGTWPACHMAEMQLCAVNRKLTHEERNVLSMLGYQPPLETCSTQ